MCVFAELAVIAIAHEGGFVAVMVDTHPGDFVGSSAI